MILLFVVNCMMIYFIYKAPDFRPAHEVVQRLYALPLSLWSLE